MKRVLIDTSVWVAHFRQRNDALINLLGVDAALMHPMILGELACATPPARQKTLGDLGLLPQTQQASLEEVIAFVGHEKLHGLGCGIVDMILLASTLITPGVALWTLDKRFSLLTERFGVLYQPPSN